MKVCVDHGCAYCGREQQEVAAGLSVVIYCLLHEK